MDKQNFSAKRIAIDKANYQLLVVTSVAVFVTVMCLFMSKALWSQQAYQGRVSAAKTETRDRLVKDVEAVRNMQISYDSFVNTPRNVIGGDAKIDLASQAATDHDGDNAKIILDALPVKYDFPALTASIEKIVTDLNLRVSNISGTDDQVNQQANKASTSPEAVEIPFSFEVQDANYKSIQDLVKALERSIRPIKVNHMVLSGGENQMSVKIDAVTYYQPAKTFNIDKKVVK